LSYEFGGVIAINRPIEKEKKEKLVHDRFLVSIE